ncbi:MAG: hypothetical protein VX501_04675 [Pseudomonadota bacterium]|nr:hypothetical protein [Pseudomonadota bacterium]
MLLHLLFSFLYRLIFALIFAMTVGVVMVVYGFLKGGIGAPLLVSAATLGLFGFVLCLCFANSIQDYLSAWRDEQDW